MMRSRRLREKAILAELELHPHGVLTRFLVRDLNFPPERQLRRDLTRLYQRGAIEAFEIRDGDAAKASQWSWAVAEGGAA